MFVLFFLVVCSLCLFITRRLLTVRALQSRLMPLRSLPFPEPEDSILVATIRYVSKLKVFIASSGRVLPPKEGTY